MKNQITKFECEIQFEGTLPELTEWLQTTFVDPSKVIIKGTAFLPGPKPPENPGVLYMRKQYRREITMPQLQAVIDLLKNGNQKIQAIKAVREATNLGLDSAKHFVESEVVQSLVNSYHWPKT